MKANHPYSTWVEVDLNAVRNNVRSLLSQTKGEVMAVVKANAYGHGFIPVARAALEAGATWCGIARPRMAVALREAGITSKMLILGYFPPSNIPEMIQHQVSLTVWTADQIQQISRAASTSKTAASIHILVDTGMGRLGCLPENTSTLAELAAGDPALNYEGIFSHLAKADERNPETTHQQEELFHSVLDSLDAQGLLPGVIHLANSAGGLVYPSTHYSLIRAGIALYGLPPSPQVDLPESIRPVLSWKSVLASIKTLPPDHGVSYGHQYHTSGQEVIGVVPLGYADGYRRLPGNQVLIRGKKVPVVGRVCMDQCMVQLDGIENPQVGDEVVLIGTQGSEQITADDLARTWNTINYEVTCGIGARVPRIFLNENKADSSR